MWPARRQVLEDFPLARMAESDCLAESGEGFPIANVQNVLVVAGPDWGGNQEGCSAPPPPPHPNDPVDPHPKEGGVPPPPASYTRLRLGEAGGGPGRCL